MLSRKYFAEKKTSLQILALLLVASVVFYPTTTTLLSQWTKWDQALGHSLLVVALICHLILRIDFQSKTNPPIQAVWFSVLLSLFFSALWFVFELSKIDLLSIFFLMATIGSLVAATTSIGTLLKLLPILGLTLFTLPVWSLLTQTLVTAASIVVGKLVYWIGIPAFIDGNRIEIAFGTIIIADGCSGLKYLIVTLLLGYFVCIESNTSKLRFTATLLFCTFVAIFANWVRIITLIIIGNETQMQSSLMHDHELFGWMIYLCFLSPILFFLPRKEPNAQEKIACPKINWLAAIPSLVIFPVLFHATDANSTNAPPYNLDRIGERYPGVYGSMPKLLSGNPTLATDAQTLLINGSKIQATLMASDSENKGKLVPYIHSIYDQQTWKETHSSTIHIEGEEYRRILLQNLLNNRKAVLMYQYDIGAGKTSNYYTAKFLQLHATLKKRRYFSLFTLYAVCADDCDAEYQAIESAAGTWTKNSGNYAKVSPNT